MEQWMIFFRKIRYLSFINTSIPVLYVPVFVSSSFCSLGGHTFGRKLLAQKSSVFCTSPKNLKTPPAASHTGTTQHPYNNSTPTTTTIADYNSTPTTAAPLPILVRKNKCSNNSTPTNTLPRQ